VYLRVTRYGERLFSVRMKEDEGLAYDEETQSIIKLSNGTVLYLREVNKYLALVCLLREDNFDKHGIVA
jgi:Ras-related GTP-binding protein C/D